MLVASPITAPREYLKYVLERHFTEFLAVVGLHASISRRKVFPKGIPGTSIMSALLVSLGPLRYRKGRRAGGTRWEGACAPENVRAEAVEMG